MMEIDGRPLAEWTDEELRQRPSSACAKEQDRRRLERAKARRAGAVPGLRDPLAAGREVLRSHTSGRDLRDALEPRVSAVDHVSVDRDAFVASVRRAGEERQRMIERAFAAQTAPRVSGPVGARPRVGRDPWARLVRRAVGAVAVDQQADHQPGLYGDRDPDSLAVENERLNTRDAVVVARERGRA